MAALFASAAPALAFTTNITAKTPRALYLQVGDGSITPAGSNYSNNGTPTDNGTINKVSASVPGASLGNGTPVAMAAAGTTGVSFYDSFQFCSAGVQVYVGGFYRRTSGGAAAAAVLTASVPASLSTPSGSTIPFSEIAWTSSGNGDTGAQPFPAGRFPAGGTITLGSINANQWAESCHAFSYANSAVRDAGVYTGRVTYTLVAP